MKNSMFKYYYRRLDEFTKAKEQSTSIVLTELIDKAIFATNDAMHLYVEWASTLTEHLENSTQKVLEQNEERRHQLDELKKDVFQRNPETYSENHRNAIESTFNTIEFVSKCEESILLCHDFEIAMLSQSYDMGCYCLFNKIYKPDATAFVVDEIINSIHLVIGVLPEGHFASLIKTLIDVKKSKEKHAKAASSYLTYLEDYIGTLFLWQELTRCELKMLSEGRLGE